MLRDRYRQLLTAYVDDELSSRQRRNVARLLKRSAEARELLQQLREDAQTLRRLPRPVLPADLTTPVLRTIAERRLAPGRRRIAEPMSAGPWMAPMASWAAAAGVLIFLGVASYLYFAASLPRSTHQDLAQKQTHSSSPTSHAEQLGPPNIEEARPQMVSSESPAPSTGRPSAAKTSERVKNPRAKSPANVPDKPPMPVKEETALTDRLEMFQFDQAPDILPVIVKVHELDQHSERRRFRTELQKDSDFRMELPCQNGTKAFDRVQKAVQALRLGLILDKKAQERIKAKSRTNYLLYFENVTPDEVIRFVQQIGVEDRKSAAGKPADLRIDRLVLMRLTGQHRKELATLLGADPAAAVSRQAEQTGPGQGTLKRPEAGKSAVKPPEHLVLVLAYNPVRSSPGSEEIKRFMENRKPVRRGTLRVLLVLRS